MIRRIRTEERPGGGVVGGERAVTPRPDVTQGGWAELRRPEAQQAVKMAENSGRTGKNSGSGAGKGTVSAEQVGSREREGGQPGWVRSRCENGGSLWLVQTFTPVPHLRGHPERGGSLEKLAEPPGRE